MLSSETLYKEIKRKGTRGGTHITNEWLHEITHIMRTHPSLVNKDTLDAIDHLVRCQEKADAYDWSEYEDQMPKIVVLRNTVIASTK